MKILKATIYNFASYKKLIFEFTDQGLTLVSGPTGSGKSTLCDIIPWILYGRTAKNGAVDDIRSWGETEAADGTLEFSIGSHSHYVRRIRGDKNDLYYGPLTDYMAEGKRGKDLADTQKQINQIVGMDVDTYLMGSYYHEFSQVAGFFTTTAKVRRSITEQLADLSLAKHLQEKLTAYNKEIKNEIIDLKQEAMLKTNTLEHLEKQYQIDEAKLKDWYDKQVRQIEELQSNAKNYDKKRLKDLEELFYESNVYEQEKKDKLEEIQAQLLEDNAKLKTDAYYLEAKADLSLKIAALQHSQCSECGAPKNTSQIMLLDKQRYQLVRDEEENIKTKRRLIDLGLLLNRTAKQVNPYTKQIEQEKQRKNTYLEQIEELNKKENPFIKSQESAAVVIKTSKYALKQLNYAINDFLVEQSDIELLVSITDEFRGIIIARTIAQLQKSTNKLLNDHFNAEIRVRFSVQEADKLDVEITKDGNVCTFTQLSKGQRQLLKLCFAVSVMKAISNHNGVSFNCLWFDEALDGMDDNIKAKAYRLLESLDNESVFVVEHSDYFKQLFINKLEVSLTSEGSQIEKA